MPDEKKPPQIDALMVDFREKIADKIRTLFTGMIPDEAWTALVTKEIRSFFDEDLTYYFNGNGYASNSRNMPGKGNTRFRQMVWEELSKMCQARLQQEAADIDLQDFLVTHTSDYVDKTKRIGLLPAAFKEILQETGGQSLLAYLLTPFVTEIIERINRRS